MSARRYPHHEIFREKSSEETPAPGHSCNFRYGFVDLARIDGVINGGRLGVLLSDAGWISLTRRQRRDF